MTRRDDSIDGKRGAGYLDRPVGELVAEHYARAAVFEDLGIDFCCGGERTLSPACDEAGVSLSVLVAALGALDASAAAPSRPDPRSWTLGRLVNHIEGVHHAYVRRTLPVLGAWTDKIVRVHGRAHPELLEVRTLVLELAAELERHMKNEETELFPRVTSLESSASADAVGFPLPDSVVEALEDDHKRAGSLTRRIRELTDGFAPPPDACATYSATFGLLREFEEDLHRHVHLENNVLFPRARALHARRAVGRC